MRYKDISIHKKILLTNFLMILIPVLFVCLILAVLLLGFSTLTDNSSLIRNVLLNSSNYGPTLLIKSLNDELSDRTSIDQNIIQIFQELEKNNLHIMITKEHELLYISEGYTKTSLNKEFMEIAQTDNYKIPYIIWNQNGMAYASSLKNKQNETWTIMFSGTHLKLPKDSYESWEGTKLKIKVGILGTGFFMIVFILLLGIILTKRLSYHILKPLSQLQRATDDIKHGNLETSIIPQSSDEFGMLCENFETMREQLVESEKQQERYEQQRKELIAGISHDLSTPLTSIQGYVSALSDGIADTPEKQRHYLEVIKSKTSQMNDLVDSLFLLSKLDMEEEPIHFKVIHLNDYLMDWYEEEKDHLYERSLCLIYECDESDILVNMDPAQFIRVLNNLCENSIKYKKEDVVHLNVSLSREKESCLLRFQDDGQGASQEDVEHLFERFYRADRARSSKIKGNGLGLAITRHIIEQMNGTIWAQGKPQEGLCVFIRLPLAKEE